MFGKEVNNLSCIVFILLPIYNSPNHSGVKKNYWLLFIIPIVSYIALSYSSLSHTLIYPFVALFFITLMENLRNNTFKFYYSLNNTISEFYESRIELGKEYSIYNDIISKINYSKFSKMFLVDKILCIKIMNKNVYVVNSSEFVAEFSISNTSYFEKKLKENAIFSNLKLSIDGNEYLQNIFIPITLDRNKYVFIVIVNQSNHILNSLQYIRDNIFCSPFLTPFFKQLAVFFETEYEFRQNRMENFSKIKNEYEYVLRTINAVHFVRNRLTPFKNYFDMATDLEEDRNIDPALRVILTNIMYEENRTAKSSLKEIITRINQVLTEGDNPFDITKDIVDVKIKDLYSEIRNLCGELFGISNIDNQIKDGEFDHFVTISRKGINIVFSDLLGNIQKYYRREYSILFSLIDGFLIIQFSNNFEPSKLNIEKIKNLIKYFESDENFNIFKMSSKGVFLIKDFLKQMKIDLEVTLNEEKPVFTSKLSFRIK